MALVGYLLIFTASYITSNTTAHYSSQQTLSQPIATGEWGQMENEIEEELEEIEITEKTEEIEESTLAFVNDEYQVIKICEPSIIKVEIENSGEKDMQEQGSYEVYYIETGDPKENGEKLELAVGEGIIGILGSGEKSELTYEVDKPGVYIFLLYQHDDNRDEDGVWSKEILIDCELVDTIEDGNIDEPLITKQEIEEENEKPEDQEEQMLNDTDEKTINAEEEEGSDDLKHESELADKNTADTDETTSIGDGEEN